MFREIILLQLDEFHIEPKSSRNCLHLKYQAVTLQKMKSIVEVLVVVVVVAAAAVRFRLFNAFMG